MSSGSGRNRDNNSDDSNRDDDVDGEGDLESSSLSTRINDGGDGSNNNKRKRDLVHNGDDNNGKATSDVTSAVAIRPDDIQSLTRDDVNGFCGDGTPAGGGGGGVVGVVDPSILYDDRINASVGSVLSSIGLYEIPDGEFPTMSQLSTVLDCLGTLSSSTNADENNGIDTDFANDDDPNDCRRKKSLADRRTTISQLLTIMQKWTERHDGEAISSSKFVNMMAFRKTFLQLGGMVRMILVIEQNMEHVEIVAKAVLMCSVCTIRPVPLENEEWKLVRSAACSGFVQHGGFRIFLLASEEFIPSDKIENWNTAVLIWAGIRTIMRHAVGISHIDFGHKLISAAETDFAFLATGQNGTDFLLQRLHVMGQYAGIMSYILVFKKYSQQAAGTLMHGRNGSIRVFLQMCQTFESQWLQEASVVHDVLMFCNSCATCAADNLVPMVDVKKWLPLVTEALLKHIKNKQIESLGFQFISNMTGAIYKGDLEKTNVYNALLSIVQSDSTSRETKDRYRALLSKLLA